VSALTHVFAQLRMGQADNMPCEMHRLSNTGHCLRKFWRRLAALRSEANQTFLYVCIKE